ncbi:Rabankyrin-5 [Schistosoma japonicum]|nr:Rabankyrin-5 [Schistosoma japonicum]
MASFAFRLLVEYTALKSNRASCSFCERSSRWKINCDVNACAQFDHSTDMKESNCHIPELARYPLHMATLNGMYELVKVLICSNRVHINQQDYNGETALHLAIKSKNEKLANLLIEAPQIDYSIRDSQGYTVFHVAVDSRQRTIAQNLLKKDHSLALQLLAGASINSQTPQKQYGLHLAVIYNRPELVHCLLENALHLAIRHAKVDCLVKLLNHSSTNCYCINMSGQLPIHLLAQHHGPVSVEMLQYLLEISVANQINAQDAAGNTPGASLGVMNSEGDTVFSLNRKKCKSSTPGRVLSQLLDSLIQEPRWEDGSVCVECSLNRHCGRLLCAQCSAFEVPIVKYELSKPVRVCETIFMHFTSHITYFLILHNKCDNYRMIMISNCELLTLHLITETVFALLHNKARNFGNGLVSFHSEFNFG